MSFPEECSDVQANLLLELGERETFDFGAFINSLNRDAQPTFPIGSDNFRGDRKSFQALVKLVKVLGLFQITSQKQILDAIFLA